MGMIGTAGINRRQKRVRLFNPGDPVPDGDGGYVETLAPLTPPRASAYIRPATTRDLERIASGTVVAQATHIVSLPYHPGITTETVIDVEDPPRPDRRMAVVFVGNRDERNVDTDLICVETVA